MSEFSDTYDSFIQIQGLSLGTSESEGNNCDFYSECCWIALHSIPVAVYHGVTETKCLWSVQYGISVKILLLYVGQI